MFPALASLFNINPDITFLNFGSFGACPKPVMQHYHSLQIEQEKDPVAFFADKGPLLLKNLRMQLSDYMHCDQDDIVCVTNPTYAVNIIAKSFALQKDDEVLSTNLEYGACCKTWAYYCDKAGAKFIQTPISLPIMEATDIVAAIKAQINIKTKLIFISHITSVTAIIMPVDAIIALGKQYNIPVFIDGAHAPAQIDVRLSELGCAYYTGACHKWMLAPKGTSFLYVHKDYQSAIDPLSISWGYKSMQASESQFIDYHELQGTRDICGFLSIAAAIEFMKAHDWEHVRKQCHTLCIHNAPTLTNLLHSFPIAPLNNRFYGQMFSCEINTADPHSLHQLLYDQYKIQIPIPVENGKTYMRYSINAFNKQADLDHLFNVIEDLKRKNIIQKLISNP